MGARLEMGKPARTGARRTLLAGVPVPIPPSLTSYESVSAVYSKQLGRWIGVQYTTKEGKAYAQRIRELMLERKAWYYSENPLHLRMLVCFPDERLYDLDNRIKPMQDALKKGGVFKDDTQIKIVEARQGPKLKPGVCFLWLDEIFPDYAGGLRWIQTPVS